MTCAFDYEKLFFSSVFSDNLIVLEHVLKLTTLSATKAQYIKKIDKTYMLHVQCISSSLFSASISTVWISKCLCNIVMLWYMGQSMGLGQKV